MKLLLISFLVLFSSTALGNMTFAYKIEGKEAIDLYNTLTKETGAYETDAGERVLVKVHYAYPGEASLRIRTEVTCNQAKALCVVEGRHLFFYDYRGE